MEKINSDNLEKALSNDEKKENAMMTKEQEIAFHQGALNTLVNERNELFKMIQNVEIIMQAHLKQLEELGVKIKKNKL